MYGIGLPHSRNELKNWCLRKMGAPVLEINLDEDQIEDRISEALAYFHNFHFDGVEKVLFKHKITATVITFAAAVVADFAQGEQLKGLTSEVCVQFIDKAADNLSIRVKGIGVTELLNGETLEGQSSGTTGVLAAANAVTLGDIDNGWVPVDDSIIGVTNVLPFNTGTPSAGSMFDINYQFSLNSMHSLISTDLITYDMFKRQIELMRFMFSGMKGLRFNRKTDKIYLDIDWLHNIVAPDEYIVFVCYKAVDPTAYEEVYSDYFVREYCYALLKQQWGENLKKFSGIALPGNVTLNGQTIYEEASAYRKELEERVEKAYQEPVDFLIGSFMPLLPFLPFLLAVSSSI